MRTMVRIQAVKLKNGFLAHLTFTDGSTKEIDLEPFLRGPVFENIRNDPQVFRAVTVDPRMGTIVWPNGADIDPDVLYHGLKPAWMESADESVSATRG